MPIKRKRVSVREGYDRWSQTYDATPNPVVALDQRYTMNILKPQSNERILDAGCGTGRNLDGLLQVRCKPVGIDFSSGMLKIAQQRYRHLPLIQADLNKPFPFKSASFDAILCALVGEHLTDLETTFSEIGKILKPEGRFVFSVFHPEMAAAGIEANFQQDQTEYRLGAEKHRLDDYLNLFEQAGFNKIRYQEFKGDQQLADRIPKAKKYIDFPVLLAIEAMFDGK